MSQSPTALATALPRHTNAQSWHTQSELVTILTQLLHQFGGVQCLLFSTSAHWPIKEAVLQSRGFLLFETPPPIWEHKRLSS